VEITVSVALCESSVALCVRIDILHRVSQRSTELHREVPEDKNAIKK
jgi:hypothetical protein